MNTLQEFKNRLLNDKKEVFDNLVQVYESNTKGKDYWNGDKLEIGERQDIYLYLSEDKKTFFTSYGKYDPTCNYSYMIYLCHYLHKANYANGAIELIGFYNNAFEKVNEIPIDKLKIIGCRSGKSFYSISKPEFFFKLEHENGNKHDSFRSAALRLDSCQKALDSIWLIEKFYEDFWTQFNKSPEY